MCGYKELSAQKIHPWAKWLKGCCLTMANPSEKKCGWVISRSQRVQLLKPLAIRYYRWKKLQPIYLTTYYTETPLYEPEWKAAVLPTDGHSFEWSSCNAILSCSGCGFPQRSGLIETIMLLFQSIKICHRSVRNMSVGLDEILYFMNVHSKKKKVMEI